MKITFQHNHKSHIQKKYIGLKSVFSFKNGHYRKTINCYEARDKKQRETRNSYHKREV